ncbi:MULTISPECIES: protein-glutamate methylesterase/protein-glutamine glutaminase [unclassified Aureimonas]|uniref:protein-glutamate methylesterase/protein-glutamine glutaminase n=1 Tax=unclassified Aureimonas TaxID=2615206 RepID=UPI0006F1E68D|nr:MULTISPECIES: chemotaxis response regulator protein-glutamate methylesterase [unclassified Aureimonas]KQT53909.1 chemotaxis protein [Aureimonas sp. Leaf427]KQT71650.1 chemotaxis protein [Aureimonas sp. Leaf460]
MIPVRVLVVDDSRTMRALLKHAISHDPQIEVVGEAANPLEARDKMKELDPDVVTLDIEMPNMNGLEFLEKIMRLRPTPVIMVSNLTQPGASATLQALETGAFDCISKPNGMQGNTLEHLPNLIKEAAKAKPRLVAARGSAERAGGAPRAAAPVFAQHADWPDLVAIGSSTGGVEALITVLSDFPADCPPTLIVQHLPATFTSSFTARLDKICKAHVVEGHNGDILKRGHVYIAPGAQHMMVTGRGGQRIRLTTDEPVNGHKPSVDVLFRSVAELVEGRMTGIILTGMGRDGAEGLLKMREAGAKTMAQDEATSLVYGMPRVAHEIGAAQKRVPLKGVARETFG